MKLALFSPSAPSSFFLLKFLIFLSPLPPNFCKKKEKNGIKKDGVQCHFFFLFFFFYKRKRREWGTKSILFSSLSSSFFFFQNSNGEMGISSSPSSFYPLAEENQWNVITFFPSPSKKKEFTLLFPLLLSSISKIKKGIRMKRRHENLHFFLSFSLLSTFLLRKKE